MDQEEAQGSQTKNSAARRSRRSVDVSWAMSQATRRSARIEARRIASGMALTPDVSQPGSRSRLRAKPTEPPRPRSSTEGTKALAATKREHRSTRCSKAYRGVGVESASATKAWLTKALTWAKQCRQHRPSVTVEDPGLYSRNEGWWSPWRA